MNLRKYLKVYKKFLHTSLASELEYKTNILVDLMTAILSLRGSIFLLSIYFQNNGFIGGWKFEQALIIQAIYTILNGITNTWFNPNLTEIVKHIREGTLFLSGLLAPVVSFPAYVKSWIYLTPFPYLIDFPANLLSGNETNIRGGLSMQIIWIFLLFPLFKKIWFEGTKKYTAMGS